MLDLVDSTGTLGDRLARMFGDWAQSRSELRQTLLAAGAITEFEPAAERGYTLAAVDGARATEAMFVADLMAVAAAAAEGITSAPGGTLAQRTWSDVRPHATGNDILAQAVMMLLELRILADIDHEVRIMDGALITPFIELGRAFATLAPEQADAIAEHILDLQVGDAVAVMCRMKPGVQVIAAPKADTESDFAQRFADDYGIAFTGTDKVLAALVLESGEMLTPLSASLGRRGHMLSMHAREGSSPLVHEAIRYLKDAVAPLRDLAEQDRFVTTYLMPEAGHTPVKIQFVATEGDPVAQASKWARVIADESPGPGLQEPFAQYAADVTVKGVSAALNGMQQQLIASLPPDADRVLALLTRGYRTARR